MKVKEKLEKRPSGLLVFSRNHKATERIIELPNGKRARLWIDDSGTVRQIEEDHRLHAAVRPNVVQYKLRSEL